MIKVSTNPQVINLYFEQQLHKVTNYQKTLSFCGTKLYSYSSLLAIIDPTNYILFIDADIRKYSNTTAKQTHTLVSKANRANYTILTLPLETEPNEVLIWYWNLIEGLIYKYIRARKHKDYYKLNIKSILEEVETFVNYSGINRKSKEYKHKDKLFKLMFEHKVL